MNDTRTEKEKYEAWLRAVNLCARNGWQYISCWIFRSPSGTLHDLSASDLTQLDRIEREGLSLA